MTDIPLSGDFFANGNALAWDETTVQFFFSADIGQLPQGEGTDAVELFTLSSTGVAASVGMTDSFFGGMAFSYQVPVELQSFTIE
ncbi:MAG: hypothetical protein V2I67_03400 [Thermoanaerobaculales bacterium]|nr:hypothetical protein [Thermoanaerobaculales bacterium]